MTLNAIEEIIRGKKKEYYSVISTSVYQMPIHISNILT